MQMCTFFSHQNEKLPTATSGFSFRISHFFQSFVLFYEYTTIFVSQNGTNFFQMLLLASKIKKNHNPNFTPFSRRPSPEVGGRLRRELRPRQTSQCVPPETPRYCQKLATECGTSRGQKLGVWFFKLFERISKSTGIKLPMCFVHGTMNIGCTFIRHF